MAGTSTKGVEWNDDIDAPLLIALNGAGLLEIRQQHLANP